MVCNWGAFPWNATFEFNAVSSTATYCHCPYRHYPWMRNNGYPYPTHKPEINSWRHDFPENNHHLEVSNPWGYPHPLIEILIGFSMKYTSSDFKGVPPMTMETPMKPGWFHGGLGGKSSLPRRQDRISGGLELKGHLRHVPVRCLSGGLLGFWAWNTNLLWKKSYEILVETKPWFMKIRRVLLQ